MTSFRGSTSFVFLSERQPMAADFLSVLISLSNCLTSSFISDFFCFGCLIWRAFASVKSSSGRPCFHKTMRWLSVLEFDPFNSDLVLGSSRCVRIIAAFLVTLKFDVSSTNDNSCWFSNSMNWKPGLFLRRIIPVNDIFIYFVYFNFKFLVDKFSGVEGGCSDRWGRWISLCCVGHYVCCRCCR